MIALIILTLIMAFILGFLGFGGLVLAAGLVLIIRILFFIFVILFLVSLIGRLIKKK